MTTNQSKPRIVILDSETNSFKTEQIVGIFQKETDIELYYNVSDYIVRITNLEKSEEPYVGIMGSKLGKEPTSPVNKIFTSQTLPELSWKHEWGSVDEAECTGMEAADLMPVGVKGPFLLYAVTADDAVLQWKILRHKNIKAVIIPFWSDGNGKFLNMLRAIVNGKEVPLIDDPIKALAL